LSVGRATRRIGTGVMVREPIAEFLPWPSTLEFR
jgi:hypothetical protein